MHVAAPFPKSPFRTRDKRALCADVAIRKFTHWMVHETVSLLASRVPAMPAGLPVALMLFAQAASAGAATGPAASPAQKPGPTEAWVAAVLRECMAANNDPNARQIVVCAPKPQ